MSRYENTHPWLKFEADFSRAPQDLWVMLGECQSKIEHLAGAHLRPGTARALHTLYLAKGVRATTAIEGNTLTEQQVLDYLDNKLKLQPSQQYLQQEIANITEACNRIGSQIAAGQSSLLSVDRIKDFNRAVLNGLELDEGVVPGQIPDFNVGVPGYRGAPREECEQLLARLCQWLNGQGFAQHNELKTAMAILKAVIAHLYLAWIHPFGDGNGRTARLVEFDILLSAGVPSPAAHLLSNHYNLTRSDYYRRLDGASKSGGDIIPFCLYAVRGLRDGLQEQLSYVQAQQRDIIWRNYVHEMLGQKTGTANRRRRQLVLDLSTRDTPVLRDEITLLSPAVTLAYSHKGERTLSRDLNALLEMELIITRPLQGKKNGANMGYEANKSLIEAFLPFRRERTDTDENGSRA